MIRILATMLVPLFLAGCGAFGPMASMEDVQRRAYVHDGPPQLTLYTVLNNRSDAGEHTALMINGSQRVLWDPAGSFEHGLVPERADLLYGITRNVELAYIDYHTRPTHRVVIQSVRVSPEQAETALRLAAEHGGANSATCARSTTWILQNVPGFESVDRTFFPRSLMAQFGALPGVTTEIITEANVDTSHNVIFSEPAS